MPTPSHGKDCLSRIYDTACRHCSNQIVVYQCNHGSVVLFEQRGYGWPRHHCANMPPEMWRYPYLGVASPQVDAVKAKRLEEREVRGAMRRYKSSSNPFRTIQATEHVNETLEAVMILRELPSLTTRIYKLDRLGELMLACMKINYITKSPSDHYLQITLQDTSTQPSSTYNAIVSRDRLRGLALERNTALGVHLESRGLGSIAEWFATDITAIESEPLPRGNTATRVFKTP